MRSRMFPAETVTETLDRKLFLTSFKDVSSRDCATEAGLVFVTNRP